MWTMLIRRMTNLPFSSWWRNTLEEISWKSLSGSGWNGMLLLASRGVNMLAQFLLFWAISRQLGQESLGVFSFVVSTIILCSYFSNLGLDTLITREVARRPQSGEELLAQLLGLRLISSLATCLFVNLIFLFLPIDDFTRHQLQMYSLCIFSISICQLFWFFCDAFDRFLLHGALWAANHLLRAFIGISLLYWGGSLDQIITGLVIAEVLSTILSGAVINRRVGRVRIAADPAVWKEALAASWPIAVAGILSVISFRIDMTFLEILRGPAEVGLYSASFKLVEMMHVVPSSLSLAIFPSLSRSWQDVKDPATGILMRKFLRLMAGCGLLCAVGLYCTAPWLIPLIYGDGFLASVPVLQILAVKVFFMFLTLPLSYALIAGGDERRMMGILFLSACGSIAANLILDPIYGQNGAAMATVFSEILLIGGYAWRYRTLPQPGKEEA